MSTAHPAGAADAAEGGTVERSLRVMGCRAHIVVHGGSDAMADAAVARLHELEGWWSRFREDSDITLANRAAGTAVAVHEDTLAVVARALLAWRQTSGRFDVTTLPALLDAGYTHSVIDHAAAPALGIRRIGMSAMVQVDYAAGTLTVPLGGAVDLGGIGKGFAADLVAEDLLEAGASGALVNLGGDLAVLGTPVDQPSWYLGIDDPRQPGTHVATLRVTCGGLATSGTTVRRWETAGGGTAHHLIDPTTGLPSAHGVRTASVLAADAATAEAFATSTMMLDPATAIGMLDDAGLAGLVVTDAGEVLATRTFEDFRV